MSVENQIPFRIFAFLIKRLVRDISHLSKGLSDLEQNGTQEWEPFSGTLFHALSHGAIRFV